MNVIHHPVEQLDDFYNVSIIIDMDNIVGKQFKLARKLGEGAFGEVFMALSIKNHSEYAVKLQKTSIKSPQLFYEAKILGNLQGGPPNTTDYGFPNVYYVGSEGDCNVMVMDLFGKSLEGLFKACNQRFDLKTTLMIGHQMIQRIQFIHKKGYLHRDIKPDNFVVGNGKKSNKIYMIDFGLAKNYVLKNSNHISYKDNKSLTGTARFASLNTHLGIDQGRRDDIEGIANVLLYLVKGSVPWQDLKANNKKQKYQKIMQKKLTIPIDVLCANLVDEFRQLFIYCRTLEFQQEPDYTYLKDLFTNALKREDLDYDYKYSWSNLTVR